MRRWISTVSLSILVVFSLISVSQGAESSPTYPPKDRINVSDGFYWNSEFGISSYQLKELYMRTSIKKGQIGLWYDHQLISIMSVARLLRDDTPEDIKHKIVEIFETLKTKNKERIAAGIDDYEGKPDIALFINGFHKASTSLMLKFNEPVTFLKYKFDPSLIAKDHPIMLIPTAGLHEFKDSKKLKAKLEEYVKLGGTLLVFGQQHGVDWTPLPNPDKNKETAITGHGYDDDLSATKKSVYVDTYHQVLSGFTSPFADIGVDGYFTSYPKNSEVLLRKTDNDKAVMIIYPYGKGRVIATSIYPDFALKEKTIDQNEINFIQNIITWAKKPATLLEVTAGKTATLSIDIFNFTDDTAAAIEFKVLDPSRKTIGKEVRKVSLKGGESMSVEFSQPTTLKSTLGIYNVDYYLLDDEGDTLQPQAEADSGRFIVGKTLTD